VNKTIEKIIILLTDFLAINLAWIVFFYFRVQTGLFELLVVPEFIIPMLVVYFYWLLIFTFVGMYRTWFAASRFDEISTLFKACFVGIFILFFLIFIDDYIHNVASTTRILLFIYWGLFLFFVGAGRIFIRSLQRNLLIKGYGRRNAIIVGFNSKAHEVHDELLKHPALGLDVAGYIALEEENISKEYKNIKVLGRFENVQSIIDNYNIKEVIISLEKEDHAVLVELLAKCEPKNVGLKIVPDLYEILSGQARTMQLYGIPLIDIMPELMPEWEKKLKRLMDLIVSLIIILFTMPVWLITAVAIKLESKGPVFFTQERCGQNGSVLE